MGSYALRRILLLFPTLLIASLLVATMVRLLPGDVISSLASGRGGVGRAQNQEARALVKVKLGLDQPFHVQYISWMFGWPKKEGKVFKTSDGGATWKKLGAETVRPLTHMTFATSTVGWALAGNIIYGTDDGGRLWLSQLRSNHSLHALFFLDEKNGWAVGDKGAILHTTEGGTQKFIEVDQRVQEAASLSTWLPLDSGTNERLYDAVFVDSENGWVVGEGGVILHTLDGGAQWEAQVSKTEVKLSAVDFFDARTGWAVGEKGTILSTRDGGLTWSREQSGTGEHLNDIAFVDAFNLWVVGEKGTILHSSDGGFKWVPRKFDEGIKQKLTAVDFGDESNGMIVGKEGTLLKTTDGGATWLRQRIVYPVLRGDTTVQQGPITRPITDVTLSVSSSGTVRAWATTVETNWRWGVVGGNLGERFLRGGVSVTKEVLRTLGPSLQLMIMSTLFALALAIPIGIFSALRQDTWGDYLGRTVAIGGLAIPSFWLGTMVILIPSFYLGWVPRLIYVSFLDDPVGNLYYFLLPALVAGVPAMAEVMRMTRAMMLETLRQDYVRTAWSKGLRERTVVIRHALKNSMIPVITVIGILIPFQLGQLVIVERIFNVPGIGGLFLQGVEKRDFPLIQGVAIFLGVIVVVSNLLVDLVYSWLDPRIRYK